MTEETKKATRAYAAVIANRMLKGELRSMLGLRAYREQAGLSRREVARRVGVNPEAVDAWESGKCWPTGYNLPKLAAALGISIEELYLGPSRDQEGGQP